MGNFEKLGILVIIVLVVTILALGIWGMNLPIADEPPPSDQLSHVDRIDDPEPDRPTPPASDPAPWPDPDPDPVPDTEPPIPDADPPPPVPSAVVEHTVKSGESLYRIAERYYGHGRYWRAIARANPSLDPDDISVGTTLVIPDRAEVVDGSTPSPTPLDRPSGDRTYVVKKGDSLYEIAQSELGGGSRWRELHRLNRDVIGPNAEDLKPGMRLRLP